MSDYPNDLDQLIGTKFKPTDTVKVQSSPGGKRAVLPGFATAANRGKVGVIEVIHEVDSTDRTTLETHYTTNRRTTFLFIEKIRPLVNWTCVWGPTRPQFTRVDKLSTVWIARSILWAITNDE